MRAKWLVAVILGGVLTLTACDSTTRPGDPDINADRAAAIAAFLADIDGAAGWAMGMMSDPRGGGHDFNRTQPCPAGGTHSVTGTGSTSFDSVTHVVSTSWSTTQTHDHCAFTHTDRNGGAVTAVIDGSVTVSGTSSYQLPEARGGERKLLSFSSTRVGSTTTTVGDRSHTCAVDVTEAYDPATNNFTIRGVICGREVNVTRPLGHSGRSR